MKPYCITLQLNLKFPMSFHSQMQYWRSNWRWFDFKSWKENVIEKEETLSKFGIKKNCQILSMKILFWFFQICPQQAGSEPSSCKGNTNRLKKLSSSCSNVYFKKSDPGSRLIGRPRLTPPLWPSCAILTQIFICGMFLKLWIWMCSNKH